MRKLYLLFFSFFLFVGLHQSVKAQTTLMPGDIAFIGYNTSPVDGFSFITLRSLDPKTKIYFTDQGWGNGTWISPSTEAHLVWDVPSSIPAGTIISVRETSPDLFTIDGTTGISLLPGFNNFELSGGDQILAYQSNSTPTKGNPGTNPTFIAGIHGDYNSTDYNNVTNWNMTATIPGNSSILPQGLTNGLNCISLFPAPGPEMANSRYRETLSGTREQLLSSINNSANWDHERTNVFDITPTDYSTPNVIVPTILKSSVSNLTYLENSPVTLDGGLTISNPNNARLTSAKIVITNNFQTSEDVLSFINDGLTMDNIASAYDAKTGVLTLSSAGSSATLADWQAALRSVIYNNSSNDPTQTSRTISITLTDINNISSVPIIYTMKVYSVNNQPTLTTTVINPTYREGSTAVSLFTGTSISTIEETQLISSLIMTISGLQNAGTEELYIDGTKVLLTNGSTVNTIANNIEINIMNSGSDIQVTLSKSGGIGSSVLSTIVNGMTYQNTSKNPVGGARVVKLNSIRDNGGTANGGVDNAILYLASSVNVVPVNDAPINSVPSAQSLFQNSSLIFSSANGNLISISDVDANDKLIEINISATNGLITLVNTQGINYISGTNASNSITFQGTLTNINAALEGLVFTPNLNYSGPASLQIVTNDLGNSGSDGAKTASNNISISVNSIPKVISINRVGNKMVDTSTKSITYEVKFSEPVSGVDATDFILTPTGTATGKISNVNPSGNAYIVTVDNLSGEGALRLDLKPTGTNIYNATNVPINGGFTTGQTFSIYRIPSTPPTITNFNGNVPWSGVGNTVNLGGYFNVTDTDFEALNNGQGDWKGATLSVQRQSLALSDVFSINPMGASYAIDGDKLQVNGNTFATFTNSNGILQITYTSQASIATTNLVNDVLRNIYYKNDTPAGDANIQFTLNDGYTSSNATISVTSDFIYVTSNIEEPGINLSNGVSLTEALLIDNTSPNFFSSIVFSQEVNNLTLIPYFVLPTYKPYTTFNVGNNNVSIDFTMFPMSFMNLSKIGAGKLTFNNFMSPMTSISVNAGTLGLTGNNNINVDIQPGVILEAEGTINGNVSVQGNLKIGGYTTGFLTVNGSLNMFPGSNLYTRINNGTNDIINLYGIGTFMGNLIVNSNYYTPINKAEFIFIKNNIGIPNTGTFINYPEGSILTDSNKTYKLSYNRGAGNDVSLTYGNFTVWKNNQWSHGEPDKYNAKDVILRDQYDDSITANSLSFESNVTVPTGKVYNITNEVVNNGNYNIVFEHGAYLKQDNDNAVNVGNISFKRQSKPIYRLETLDWSSPVLGQNVFQLSPETLQNRFYHFDESTNNWIADLTSTSIFTPGEYVAFRSPNTFNNYVEKTDGLANIFEGTFTGVPNNGIVTKSVTMVKNGNNAVGNPYPSPIDLDKFYTSNPSVSKVFVWTHSNHIKNGVYEGDNWAVNNKFGWNNPIANNIIGVGQGFIAQVSNTTPLTFDKTIRVTSAPAISYKNNAEDDKFWLSLLHDSKVMNSILIGYKDGSTIGYDNDFDAEPLEQYSGLYSTLNNKLMSIQARGNKFDVNDAIQLGLKFNTSSNYTIKLAKTNGIFSNGQSIYLKDNELNKIIDLTKENYDFIEDSGEFNNRFEIVYVNNTLNTNELTQSKNIQVVEKDKNILVKSTELIKDIEIYTIDGRLLDVHSSVNAKSISINPKSKNSILIVKVSTINGIQYSTKIIIK